MKKLVLLGFMCFAVLSLPVSAQTLTSGPTPLYLLTPMPKPVLYSLPYAGILPDNPFYFLKATRDKLVSILISDPLKKAQFDLLQADKRMAAAISLSAKKPVDNILIESTLGKSENYFQEAIVNTAMATRQHEVSDMASRLSNAAIEYLNLYQGMAKNASPALKTGLINNEERMRDMQSQVNKLYP